MSGCNNCSGPKDPTHTSPAYRRALWIVVILNAGYGAVEIAGGFLASSQALKADALDFLGDGSITFVALLALSWSKAHRARVALLQGAFLALLGMGVLASTVYRVFVTQEPEAILMGGFGLVALAVNLVAAATLIKFKDGDSGVRAVWLFSRNDAVGNVAVVAGAALVWLTGTPWPDLVVALAVATLFLRSAWEIITNARKDLAHQISR